MFLDCARLIDQIDRPKIAALHVSCQQGPFCDTPFDWLHWLVCLMAGCQEAFVLASVLIPICLDQHQQAAPDHKSLPYL